MLLDAARYLAITPVKGFYATIFRRETKQITNPGGLWDESMNIYPLLGGVPVRGLLTWRWPQYGTRLEFHHLYEDKDRFAYQGAQIPYIGFDELTHFTEDQFFYLVGRNRSACGVTPRVRANTNPDPDSWVKRFFAPWLDDTFPFPAQSGEIRWFVREGSSIHWLKKGEYHPDAMSVTFIAAKITDNKIFMAKDPTYIKKLQSLSLVERRRLLYGDWNIRKDGNRFKRQWFQIVDSAPADVQRTVRYWDLAATEPKEGTDPDYTVGVKVCKGQDGCYYVQHVARDRMSPNGVQQLIHSLAEGDGKGVDIYMEQEPGSSGVNNIDHYRREVLAGYSFHGVKTTGSKEVRSNPVSSMAEGGNIKLVRGYWNDAFLNELEAFPSKGVHDDQVDAFVGAMEQLFGQSPDSVLDWSRQYLAALRGAT